MNDRASMEGGGARASDRERQRAADELRVHWAEGRLDVEQLEHRLERAMSASTVQELAELVCDLPSVTVFDPIESPPAKVRVGPPGIRPFTRRIEVPASIDRARRITLDTVAVGLNRSGYELIYQDPTELRFQRSEKERLSIDLEERGPSNTTMIVYGRASRGIRKQFMSLRF